MKLIISIIISLSVFLQLAQAQQEDEQKLVIPLTTPNNPGTLKLHLVTGSINVIGYNGKEVLITVKNNTDKRKTDTQKNGMFRIPNKSYNITVVEKNNEVDISCHAINKPVIFEIMVPQAFSLNLHTVNNGNISVENIKGEIETNNVNGSIYLSNISGSVVASSINGAIEVGFETVTPDIPMAFSSLNGKIEVRLPANIKASAKISSERGEVYSDFEMEIQASKPVVEKKASGNYKKYTIDKWVYANINGGGPEFLFKNMNGNIYIRKN
ncbi:MAG: hypothetical protein AAGI07_10855 [Bacteroidota bacterium]